MLPTLRRTVPCRGANQHKQNINRIWVSEEERVASRLSLCNIRKSLEEFHRNGFVILENAVGYRSLEHTHRRMLEDFGKGMSKNLRWNQGPDSGNVSQPLPSFPEYLHGDIWANRLGVDILENIIGSKPQLSFATSNIALPRSKGRQAVHSDYYCDHLHFPVFLEVNVYLHDVDSHNGATEFWCGTHQGYSKYDHSSPEVGWIKQEVFTAQATVSPPIQPAISKGSLVIRDLRCWHAGRENQANEPRFILGFLFNPRWFGSHMRMKFPESARPRLESWNHIDCLTTAEFIADGLDYLAEHQNINLTQNPSNSNVPYLPRNGPAMVTFRDYWTPS